MFPLDGTPEPGAERKAQLTITSIFPAQYRSVQRAILTVAGKQFPCDGVLEVSTNAGWHLAIVSNLGLVAGLRVNRDGSCEVLQVTPLFREAWTRQFVAQDVRRLFIPPTEFVSAGRLADGRLVCETAPESDGSVARYVFSADGQQWQELSVWRGGRCEYHVVLRGYRTFPGTTHAVPAEMEVQAEGYRLHLRLVELNLKDGILSQRSRNPSSADFQVCCVAGFQTRRLHDCGRPADLEVGDTAGLETCATKAGGRCLKKFSQLVMILTNGGEAEAAR